MKRLNLIIIILSVFMFNQIAFATDNQTTTETNTTINVVAPKWEDYVPTKYQNPRTDFTKGSGIAELSVGIALTDLIITAPIGIPMIVHGTTKIKNVCYHDKKIKFYKGLAEAEKITNPEAKKAYYNKLLKECKMSSEMKYEQSEKQAKIDKKAAKKAAKLQKKEQKAAEKAEKQAEIK